ncbi:MAG: hypothetical protein ABI480_13355 [Chitinophagaceae bacterium]
MKYFVAILLSSFLLVSCHHFKEPELKGIDKVNIGKIGFSETKVVLHMKYFNPNHFSAKLKEAEGDAWMDSLYLGHFRVDSTVFVPAKSDFIVPVNLGIDMKYLIKHSLSVFVNEEANIKITGTARAGRNGFYKTFPLKYNGKQNLAKLFGQPFESND